MKVKSYCLDCLWSKKDVCYLLDSAFFPGRHAEVIANGKTIGVIGVLHPNVIEQFGLKLPCSALEIDIEQFVWEKEFYFYGLLTFYLTRKTRNKMMVFEGDQFLKRNFRLEVRCRNDREDDSALILFLIHHCDGISQWLFFY